MRRLLEKFLVWGLGEALNWPCGDLEAVRADLRALKADWADYTRILDDLAKQVHRELGYVSRKKRELKEAGLDVDRPSNGDEAAVTPAPRSRIGPFGATRRR